MSEQQNTTPPDDSTPPTDTGSSGGGSRGRSGRKKSEAADGGVELYRGEGKERVTVRAYKPGTITRLKSEGWMPVEEENA